LTWNHGLNLQTIITSQMTTESEAT